MNTLFFGQFIIRLDRVDSTNNYTSEYLRQNVMPEGAVVVAKQQFAGKGQRGNSWISETGKNLTCSFYVKPKFISPSEQFQLNKWVSCAIVQTIEELGFDSKIKWPNDIYVHDQKIAGILIENSIGNQFNHSVIGIGLNVNQQVFEDLKNPTSLAKLSREEIDVNRVLEVLCTKLEQGYLILKNKLSAFDDQYLSNLYRKEEWASYKDSINEFQGMITGVDQTGKLVLVKEGIEKKYDFKEIEFL